MDSFSSSSPSSWIQPLTFRGLRLANNLFQAPLAGYSSAPFRFLVWKFGSPGLVATEMISALALVYHSRSQERYLARHPDEGPVSFQLWGRDPDALAEATRIVDARGADIIDLNCGCPVRKVRAAGAGSKLLEEPDRIGRILTAMRKATPKPLSVKIRVGIDAEHFNGPEIARIAADAGVDFLIVHGRHAKESYGTPVRLAEIERVVRAVSIPVIGNGDVRDGASAKRMLETGCVGVMVGRACMGAPWIFAKIRAELQGETFSPPSLAERGQVFLEHHDRLAELVGPERAIRHCRKLGSFYGHDFAGAKDFRGRLQHCQNRESLATLIREVLGSGDRTRGLGIE